MNLKQTIKRIALALTLIIMALYPTYKNIANGSGLSQYDNHKLFIEGNSNNFDPWQYRILCPLLVEQLYYRMDGFLLEKATNTFQKMPIPEKAFELRALQKDALLFKYTIIFVLFRFIEHLLIYALLWQYLSLFTKNRILISLFILIATWTIGSTVMNSDLSLNTYMDIIFYLLAAYIIAAQKNSAWIIPLSILAALNRETAAFIPLMLFFAHCDFKTRTFPSKMIWIHTITSIVLFFSILFAIRFFYSYRPETHPWNLLKFNLFSANSFYTYFEIFSAIGFLPLFCLNYWRRNSIILQTFFWLIVPLWFTIHLVGTMAREARCFLVPMFVVFMPMIVEIIEQKYKENNITS